VSVSSVRPAGDAGLLLELPAIVDPRVNATAIGIAESVRDAHVAGVRDVVPAFSSVAVYFDPLATDLARLESVVRRADGAATAERSGRSVDIPVAYGGEYGPDLGAVAEFSGLAESHVIELHAGHPYRVFMLGFQPGFPYLAAVDERIAMPRRASPRVRVPAGSVGIAGLQTGIYPRESPGGWQIVGRTAVAMFDPTRSPAALLAPGDTVRFVPEKAPGGAAVRNEGKPHPGTGATPARRVTVLRPGLLTTIQDAGRWGHQASGVPVAGPLDSFSHRLANALVGNDRDAAALEITLSGPELRLEHHARLAVTGADLSASLDGAPLPMNRAIAARAGSVVRFGPRRHGARAYLAFDGGISVPPVLGSRATDVSSGIGGLDGRPLRAGDALPLAASRLAPARRRVQAPDPEIVRRTTLRILPGPQDAAFSDRAMDILVSTEFMLSVESNRMGYRLAAGRIPAGGDAAMISGPVFTGSIQVPPAGEPVLLMSERQTTGGYPQIATVITADLPSAAQLAPGDRVGFEACSRKEAIAALVAQEGMLLALA
jgi:KipI family sensor histidine kinase inhibitor